MSANKKNNPGAFKKDKLSTAIIEIMTAILNTENSEEKTIHEATDILAEVFKYPLVLAAGPAVGNKINIEFMPVIAVSRSGKKIYEANSNRTDAKNHTSHVFPAGNYLLQKEPLLLDDIHGADTKNIRFQENIQFRSAFLIPVNDKGGGTCYWFSFFKKRAGSFSKLECERLMHVMKVLDLALGSSRKLKKHNAADKNESLLLYHSGILHDINNRLSILLGDFVSAKSQLEKNSDASEILNNMEKSFLRVIDFSKKLLPSNQEMNFLCRDIASVIRELTEFVFKSTKIQIKLHIENNLSAVQMDEVHVIQVLQNILINAKQAMDGQGQIEIQAKNIELKENGDIKPGKYVLVSVKDSGCGIQPEDLNKIFQPHFSTKENGSGIGLASCNVILMRCGGAISVSSIVNQGSDFFLYFPAFLEMNKPVEKNGKILLIENDDMIVSIMKKIIENGGYEVLTARSDDDTDAILSDLKKNKEKPALAVIDLTFAGEDSGVRILEKIKRDFPEIKSILITGYTESKYFKKFAKYGFDDVLEKPFSYSSLISKLDDLLDA